MAELRADGGTASPRFRRGLVVGKFAPLHLGHEHLIRRAAAACDEVVLVSYASPERPGCGPEVRARWLARRFPRARRLVVGAGTLGPGWAGDDGWDGPAPPPDAAADDVHRRFVALLCRHVLRTTVDAVFTSEGYGDGFADVLTREFRRRDPDAPPVRHVCVDPARAAVPASGTAIRADVDAGRALLAPSVYASFVRRVCLLGGESSGKSTLAAALAARLGTAHAPEYGRELWERRGGRLAYEDLLHIGRRQVAREEARARRARRWLVCDTSPLTTLLYSRALFGRADPALERLADERRYDLTLLCAPDFPFVQDGTRRDDRFRREQHAWYRARLAERGGPWAEVGGPLPERVEAAVALLAGA